MIPLANIKTNWENAKSEAMMRRFASSGQLVIENFQATVFPPLRGYDEEPIRFEITSVGITFVINIAGINYLLLVQQADRPGFPWEIPSGGVDKILDQHPLDTGVRELHEETGISVPPEYLLPLTYSVKPGRQSGGVQYFIFTEVAQNALAIDHIDAGVIFLDLPEIVNKSEIKAMALEPLRSEKASLLATSAHSWAYHGIFNALAQKGIT